MGMLSSRFITSIKLAFMIYGGKLQLGKKKKYLLITFNGEVASESFERASEQTNEEVCEGLIKIYEYPLVKFAGVHFVFR